MGRPTLTLQRHMPPPILPAGAPPPPLDTLPCRAVTTAPVHPYSDLSVTASPNSRRACLCLVHPLPPPFPTLRLVTVQTPDRPSQPADIQSAPPPPSSDRRRRARRPLKLSKLASSCSLGALTDTPSNVAPPPTLYPRLLTTTSID